MGSVISKNIKNKPLIFAEIIHNNETVNNNKINKNTQQDNTQINYATKLCCKNIENHSKINQDFTKFCYKKIEDYSNACINSKITSQKNVYAKLELEYLKLLYLRVPQRRNAGTINIHN